MPSPWLSLAASEDAWLSAGGAHAASATAPMSGSRILRMGVLHEASGWKVTLYKWPLPLFTSAYWSNSAQMLRETRLTPPFEAGILGRRFFGAVSIHHDSGDINNEFGRNQPADGDLVWAPQRSVHRLHDRNVGALQLLRHPCAADAFHDRGHRRRRSRAFRHRGGRDLRPVHWRRLPAGAVGRLGG